MKHTNSSMVLLAGAVIASALSCSSANAAIFSENFNGSALGVIPEGAGQTFAFATEPLTSQNGITVVNESTSTAFGTPNQFVNYDDSSGSSARLLSNDFLGASGVMTSFSFDFVEPSAGGTDRVGIGYAIAGGDVLSSGARASVALDDGNILFLDSGIGTAAYALDNPYRISMVFNDTLGDLAFMSENVAAQTAGVWLQDLSTTNAAVYVGSKNATLAQTTAYRIGFRSFGSAQQQLYIDNISVTAVPEPSSLALLGVSACGLMFRRRKR